MNMEKLYKNCIVGSMVNSIEDGWYVMEDYWIRETDKVLVDNVLNEYHILDWKEISKEIPFNTGIETISLKKIFSCVKLDKKVNIGVVLHVKLNENEFRTYEKPPYEVLPERITIPKREKKEAKPKPDKPQLDLF